MLQIWIVSVGFSLRGKFHSLCIGTEIYFNILVFPTQLLNSTFFYLKKFDMPWNTSPRISEDTQGAWKNHSTENCKISFFTGAFSAEDKIHCQNYDTKYTALFWSLFFSVSCFPKDDLKLCLLSPKNKQLMHMTECQECRTLPFT